MPSSPFDAQVVARGIDTWNAHILQWALILTAAATITMALLELVKAVTFARPKYHRFRLQRWLRNPPAYAQLLMLSIGDIAKPNALFDQPANKMMGQIQAAAGVAIDFPDRFPEVYAFLTRQAGADAEVWKEFCLSVANRDPSVPLTPAEQLKADTLLTAATRARARIDHFVARKLDAFQTVTEYVWARANQVLAVLATTAFLIFIVKDANQAVTWRVIISAFFGGMIAPLSKDVVSALSGLRAGKP